MAKTETAIKPADDAALANVTDLPDDLIDTLELAGIAPAEVNVPSFVMAMPVEKDELIRFEAPAFKGAVSDVMVVAKVIEFPEADRFPGYKGYLRAECWLRDGQYVAWTTHLFNKTTGELGPIAEYLRGVPAPCAIRLGKFESKSNPGQFVYRPVPVRMPANG